MEEEEEEEAEEETEVGREVRGLLWNTKKKKNRHLAYLHASFESEALFQDKSEWTTHSIWGLLVTRVGATQGAKVMSSLETQFIHSVRAASSFREAGVDTGPDAG